MRILMIPMAAMAMTAAMPALARDNGPHDRQYASRGEVERSRDRLQNERQDLRQARRYGDRHDVKQQQRDVKRAQKEYRRDRNDLQRAHANSRYYQERRDSGNYWNSGSRYNYNRPDPRYDGYYANNYYRAGNYRPYQLRSNDRVYRGSDNRYYCRRSDGTTGLIVGAIGGGVLGNAIAPGGSKTIGAILGGSLGAILGKSIDGGNMTCR